MLQLLIYEKFIFIKKRQIKKGDLHGSIFKYK